MALARRTVVSIWLSAVGGGLVLLLGCVVTWVYLPKWAPDWVVDHSPFIEPVMRAMNVLDPPPTGTPESAIAPPFVLDRLVSPQQVARGERLGRLSAQAIPYLEACLADSDQVMRLQALKMLSWHGLPREAGISALLHDSNPWIRLNAWLICTNRHEGVDQAELTATLALLSDHDAEIRAQSQEHLADVVRSPDNLRPDARFVWDDRAHWYERLRPHVHPSQLADMFIEIFRELTPEELPLPNDLTFPLLWLAQLPDPQGNLAKVVAEYLPLVDQNPTKLYALLEAMNRGERPWEPGAQPWMYEQMHFLFNQRVSVSLKDVDISDIAKLGFPQGNVAIDPRIIAAAPPPVTLEVDHRPMIEVLVELARIFDGRPQINWAAGLYFDSGVAYLVSPERARFGKIHGFVPGRVIELAPGTDPNHAIIRAWRKKLEHRCSISDQALPLHQWFTDVGSQADLPIDVQAIKSVDWDMEIHLHNLPLEQILQFMAGYCDLHMELGVNGLRIMPSDSR